MLWTDLFLLWNRISHITRYLLPVNARKHCISNSLKYHASPHFLYCPIDIITLLSDTPLGVTVSIKKEASSLFTHYWLPILLILFWLYCFSYTLRHTPLCQSVSSQTDFLNPFPAITFLQLLLIWISFLLQKEWIKPFPLIHSLIYIICLRNYCILSPVYIIIFLA